MRKLLPLALASCLCLLAGCADDACDHHGLTEIQRYSIHEPVFMSADLFRNSVRITDEPVRITQKGKISFYEDYLFISSPEKGIHIVDNRNPSSPQIAGYIELIGNREVAIRDHKLYADSYVDLVWFDLSDPGKPELKGRLENAFPYSLPPMLEPGYGFDYQKCFADKDRKKEIVVGWEIKERVITVEHHCPRPGMVDDAITSPGMSQGVNGSMSCFSINDAFLYTVNRNMMWIFDLSGDKPLLAAREVLLRRDVETLFSYEDKLFMGTPSGMLIYSLENPKSPHFRSAIDHVRAYDPVVVEGDLAYVTIHSDTLNGRWRPNANELIVIDISDVDNPQTILSYGMSCPKGLGIDAGTLFICDDGLKVFDAQDPKEILSNQLAHYTGMDGYDLIPYKSTLMMIASDGIYQYDYSDPKNITLLSKLPIGE